MNLTFKQGNISEMKFEESFVRNSMREMKLNETAQHLEISSVTLYLLVFRLSRRRCTNVRERNPSNGFRY